MASGLFLACPLCHHSRDHHGNLETWRQQEEVNVDNDNRRLIMRTLTTIIILQCVPAYSFDSFLA